jgi:putative transposase
MCGEEVWSTDITYIKIAGGMVYMAAIIDWHLYLD